jgi:asparagine synthetase B (glutamine-hydrolysing)
MAENGVSDESICGVLSHIEAVFAFVLIDTEQNVMWFGHDYFGRRSLLVHRTETSLHISSVGFNRECSWTELPPDGIYRADLESLDITKIGWQNAGLATPAQLRFAACDPLPLEGS